MTDTLRGVVVPTVVQTGTPPTWVVQRGQDVRCFDRRDSREVGGPTHPFVSPSDIKVENGILRFWVGPRGIPYLHLQAYRNGRWREVGYVLLQGDSPEDTLVSARLQKLTLEEATVELTVRNAGSVHVTLKRGEPMLRITHGDKMTPATSSGRYVRLQGHPPALIADFAGTDGQGEGKFGNALDLDIGELKLPWPTDASRDDWGFGFFWTPDSSDSPQPDSGFFAIFDSLDQVGKLEYDTTTKTIVFTLGAQTVTSPALSFAAGDHLFVGFAFSTTNGMALTVDDGVVHHAADTAAINPGTSDTTYSAVYWGFVSVIGNGQDDSTGGDNDSGLIYAHGMIDNVQRFDWLTQAERASLASAGTGLENLPSEVRLIEYMPFAAALVPTVEALTSGRRMEATANNNGQKRGLAVLEGNTIQTDGFSLGLYGQAWEAAVMVTVEEDGSRPADQHAQFAAASEQEIRIR